MKRRLLLKFTSVLLVTALLFTSNYYILHIFAADNELTKGVGIYNHVMTDDNTVETKYIIKFFQHYQEENEEGELVVNERQISFPAELQVTDTMYLTPYEDEYVNDSAVIFLGVNEEIEFTQNNHESNQFVDFIKANEIDRITITYDTGVLNRKETSLLYGSPTQEYNFYYIDEDGEEPDETGSTLDYTLTNPFDIEDEEFGETVKQFDSTKMIEFTVEQDWRDRGTERPDNEDIKFDIDQATGQNAGTTYLAYDEGALDSTHTMYVYEKEIVVGSPAQTIGYNAYMEIEVTDSNNCLYHYTVPEKSPDGDAYHYSSDQHFPSGYEDKFMDGGHPDNDPNKYLAIGLTTFTFTMNWIDAFDPSARPEINEAYIEEYFELHKKTGENDQTIEIVPDGEDFEDYVTVVQDASTGVYTVTLKRLEDIAENGTAVEYFLKLKNNETTVPINEHPTGGASYQDDWYTVKSENTGIHANITNVVYDTGKMNLFLTGATDFVGTVEWEDNAKQSIRKGDDTAANFTLWRYAGDDSEYAAIVSDPDDDFHNPQTIGGTNNSQTITFANLDKYDNKGQLYHYYAVEALTVEDTSTASPDDMLPYQVIYEDANHGGKPCLINGGTVTNKLSDTIQYSVSAEWIAAARQGGTASADYQLERAAVPAEGEDPVWSPLQVVNFTNTQNWEQVYVHVLVPDGDGGTEEWQVVPMTNSGRDASNTHDTYQATIALPEHCSIYFSNSSAAPDAEGVQSTAVITDLNHEGWSAGTLDEDGKFAADAYPADPNYRNPFDRRLDFDELHMHRTSNEEDCIYPVVDMYDEHGNRYQYRVVQTHVERTDNLPRTGITTASSNTQVTAGESKEVKINDKYQVAATANGSDFHFRYNIEGDTIVTIKKEWLDENGAVISPLNSDYEATFDVQNYNNDTLEYVDYFVKDAATYDSYFKWYVDNGFFVERVEGGETRLYFNQEKAHFTYAEFGDNWYINNIAVPKYDVYGREIAYRAVEVDKHFPANQNIDFYTTYSWDVTYTGENGLTTSYNYVADNHRTSPGREYAEIAVNKEWVDDGEQEYREPIKIVADESVYTEIDSNSQPIGQKSTARVLNQQNVWESRFPVTWIYKRDPQTHEPLYDNEGNHLFEARFDYASDPDNSELFHEEPVADQTVKFTNNLNWSSVYVYAWDQNRQPLCGAWPGKLMTDIGDNGFGYHNYQATVPEGAIAVIFNSGNNGEQTTDINDLNYEGWYLDETRDSNGKYIPKTWGSHKYYWSKAEIESGNGLSGASANDREWIYQLLTGKKWGSTDYSNGQTLDDDNSVDLTLKNMINFDGFAGIYKSAPLVANDPTRCHYYAVRQVYSDSAVNGAVGTLRFINTRIGVISYEIKFDWNVGDALTREDNKIQDVTVKISGAGLEGGYVTQTIKPDDLVPLADGTKAFYFLNLPKYDSTGKLIEYTIEEISIGNQTVSNGVVNVGDDRCVARVSTESITEGAEAKTDDLHSITITNTFVDSDSISVHKKWGDSNNAEKTRSDLYIRLFRQSSKPGATEEAMGDEYEWAKNPQDTISYWTYTFRALDKYDADGYPYTYYVKEQPPERLPNYDQLYQPHVTYQVTDPEHPEAAPVTVRNPKVHLADGDLRDDVVYDGGAIVNRLYGELTIEGDKLWKNISNLLEKRDYPIARVTLIRKINKDDINDEQLEALQEYALTDEEFEAGEIAVAVTTVRSGANHFKFGSDSVTQRGSELNFVLKDEHGDPRVENGNIVLPKYDGIGRAIEYELREESINGYISKIVPGTQRLINEYNGGAPVKIDVTKIWQGMSGEPIFPTIKFVLHQVISVGDESNPRYIEYNTFEREFTATSDGNYTVHFGDRPEEAKAMRYYSPVGTPFIYFVTETLSNYDGYEALFIEDGCEQYIPQYLAPYRTNPKAEIITLDPNNRTGRALGFTSTISPLPDAEETARQEILTAHPELVVNENDTEEQRTAKEAELNKQLKDRLENTAAAAAIKLDQNIQNVYKPTETNFQGRIDVTKAWDLRNSTNQLNNDYSDIKSYNFTLTRKTKKTPAQTLFKVTTIDSLSGDGVIPHFTDYDSAVFTLDPTDPVAVALEVTPHDFEPCVLENDEYVPAGEGVTPTHYVGVILNKKEQKKVTVVIDVYEDANATPPKAAFHNTVHISGLAIYGHDATKYNYTVTEDSKPGFYATKGRGTEQLSNNTLAAPPVVDLQNRLRVFDLKLYKAFGREYQDDTDNQNYIEPIPYEDFEQFFNNAYFQQLTFKLWRSVNNVQEENPYKIVTGEQIMTGDESTYLDTDKNAYFYIFRDLPLTDIDGNPYTYWIEEVDGAQTGVQNPKVFTLYDDEPLIPEADEGDEGDEGDEPQQGEARIPKPQLPDDYERFTLENSDTGREKETYVTNVFVAKKINIQKYWLDNDNEDGKRPESLVATITENVPGKEPITFTRQLDNENEWQMEAALARYYFNGAQALEDLTYSINEDLAAINAELPNGYDSYTLVTESGRYGKAQRDVTGDTNVYIVPEEPPLGAPVSDVNPKPIGEGVDSSEPTFDKLVLTNYRIPHKGEITLEKKFNEPTNYPYKADTRPDNLYFQLWDGNTPVTDYTGLKLTATFPGDGNTTVDATVSASGVITVPCDGDPNYTYPVLTVSNLPIGSSTDASSQSNGTEFVPKQYKFVECDAAGTMLINADPLNTFPYTWDGGKLNTASADGSYADANKTVTIDENTNFTNDFEIVNSLRQENHEVLKQWNDDANNGHPNYYETRKSEFHVTLERTTDDPTSVNPAPTWTAVVEDVQLQTVMDSLEPESYSDNPAFRNLPQYDKNGNRYYYRVRETFVGPNTGENKDLFDTSKHTVVIGGVSYPASTVYYVQYDSNPGDQSTKIDNHLIRRTKFQNYKAQKIWNDELNQDGKREPIKVVLNQYEVLNASTHERQLVAAREEWLNEENNWFYQWTNYPNNDEHGHLYEYDVVELTDVTGYTNSSIHVYSTEEGGVEEGELSYEKKDFTNSHTQESKNLTVTKQWTGEGSDPNNKLLRPTSITYELYCQFTAYKYMIETDEGTLRECVDDADMETAYRADKLKIVEDTSKSYDGPVNSQNNLLLDNAYYPDIANRVYTKTIAPDDPTVDSEWNVNDQNESKIVFENLPVYINTCATDRWNGQAYEIKYYVKEISPTFTGTKVNPYIYGYGDDAYGGSGNANSTATDLTGDDPNVTVTNKLKTRDIVVEKEWVDNGYDPALHNNKSLHYDLDFLLKCDPNSASGYTYSQVETLPKSTAANGGSVTFTALPKYDRDGTELDYAVDEFVKDSGTLAEYLQNIGTHNQYNYQKTETSNDDNDGILVSYKLTNTLPVVIYKADKVWFDNSNQDGQRPSNLAFTLTGTADNVTDIETTLTDGSAAHANDGSTPTLWNVDFQVQPQYNANNTPYVYTVTEEANEGQTLAARGYQRYIDVPTAFTMQNDYEITDNASAVTNGELVSVNNAAGIAVKTFHFKNRYLPLQDSLTINKQWNDTGYEWARPSDVTVDLYYSYNGGQPVKLADQNAETDPVKKLFPNPSSYAFTKTVAAGDSWTNTFQNLPLNVNIDGTTVYNGTSYPITYSVREASMAGYTKDDSQSTTLDVNANDALTVSNTVNTKTVEVQKVWNDHEYDHSENHYPVHLTLNNTNTGRSYTATDTIPVENSNDNKATFVVPLYVNGNTPATYEVSEDSTDQQYRYQISHDSEHPYTFTATQLNNVIRITNELPLTQVKFEKDWQDSNDQYSLRPSSISVTLYRRVKDSDAEWTQCQVANVTAADNWQFTYSRLPKFNADNQTYEYKVIETPVNAYDTGYKNKADTAAEYVQSPVTIQDNTDTVDSTITFQAQNTLITKPITLRKIWDYNGYAESLNYSLTYTVASSLSGFNFTTQNVSLTTANQTSTANGRETWETSITVPVYDSSGTPIRYTVDEVERKYGYEKSATATTQTGSYSGTHTYANFYDSYTITNTLPLTSFTADKQWAGDQELYPNASADVKIDLLRKSGSSAYAAVQSNVPVSYANGASVPVTFDHLLQYDEGNNLYTYKISEQLVQGYSTTYANQEIAANSAGSHTVTITNTPIKAAADFVKYDLTDLEKHGEDARFKLITLAGAEFELYRERDGETDKKFFVTESPAGSGNYTVVEEGTTGATDTIVSRANGKITINNLEPNRYYLKEKTAPEGYQLSSQPNDQKYYFTYSIDAANNVTVTYVNEKIASRVTDSNQNLSLLLDGNDLTAAAARNNLTNLNALNLNDSSIPSAHGIPNEENMSHLTLTKQDEREHTALPNATYYLLRLINFEYRKAAAQGADETEYLANALNTLTVDYSDSSELWVYWEKVGSDFYVTDANGQIRIDGHMFGTYIFYEVKAPVGYERDFTHSDTVLTDTHIPYIGPVEMDSHNALHGQDIHFLTHSDPRKQVQLRILKTDENGNPLKGAVFTLYQKDAQGNATQVNLPDTVITGYDGLNSGVITLDSKDYDWGQKFFFREDTAPRGYSADNDGGEKKEIEFTLTPELADETLHIVRANDSRLRGRVELTKTSSAPSANFAAGAPLSGAVFELYDSADQRLNLHPLTSQTTAVTSAVVAYPNDAVGNQIAGYDYTRTVTTVQTDANGVLHVEGIDWGDYYLKEVTPPAGCQLPADANARKVSFSVGRNNCGDDIQQLTMKNDPFTAKLNIVKHIDQKNVAAWGEPVFIFKLRQTAYYDGADYQTITNEAQQPVLTKTISPATSKNGGYEGETGVFEIEPGVYTVSEVRVARYAAAGTAMIKQTLVSDVTLGTDQATFTIAPDGEAEVKFTNELKNYEKLSHVNKAENRFDGVKAIRVNDLSGLRLSGEPNANGEYSKTINKSELAPVLIRSSGATEPITDYAKLVITTDDSEITVTDNGGSITVTGHGQDISSSTFELHAVYDNRFSDDFELRFASDPLFDKTEKTVTFLNDTANMSYYEDGGQHNGVYTLIYIMENTTPNTVKKVLHNGQPNGTIPTPIVDVMYNDRYEFDKWSVTVNNGTPVDAADNTALQNQIINAPHNASITVRAVLRQKTP